MSTVITTTVLPDSTSNDTLTFGATGDSLAISGDSLNLNTLQDAGGNTIFVSDGSGTITSQSFPGALTLISTQTPSGVTSVEFTSDIDSTYDVYIFKFIDINPETNNGKLQFNGSDDSGSTYAVVKTTSMFTATHGENDSGAALTYEAGYDLDQSTADQVLMSNMSSEADASMSGEFHLFSPSSTTYVKHFNSCTNFLARPGSTTRGSANTRVGGYFNTTSAINAVRFVCSTGNFDGIIKLYGISKS